MTYLEFHTQLKGFDFYQKSKRVYRFQLYLKNLKPINILEGKYNITKIKKTR